MLFSFQEIFDIIVMSLAIGFIFKDVFKLPSNFLNVEVITPKNYLSQLKNSRMNDFWYAVAIVAPSIIFHEFGHKFVALAHGMSAVFHAAYTWLGIGMLMKVIGGFIFLVPAYVSISGSGSYLQYASIAFAGPAVNLFFWILASLLVKKIKFRRPWQHFLLLTSKINMFLFIFNMLPIPGFDGFSVYSNLLSALFA